MPARARRGCGGLAAIAHPRSALELLRLSIDLQDERRVTIVAYVACRFDDRVALAALVRLLPRHPDVHSVCWESLPSPDEGLVLPA
jgi:hypothetical protein